MFNLRILIISILIGILSGLSISSFADDIELYTKKVETVDATEGSNILFMLDNSGSMNRMITDTSGNPSGKTRIDVLKEALDLMLDNAANVNMGLGRFAALINGNAPPVNAPIIFPVEFIDKDIRELEGEENDTIGDITVSVIQGSDDAEQFEESGEMVLYESNLDMTTRQNEIVIYDGDQIQNASVTTQKFVYNGADDAEEFLNDNKLQTGRDIMYLGTRPKSATVSNDTNTLVGLRFRDLNIPPGVTILGAKIEFVSAASHSSTDNLNIAIYGAANDGLYFKDPSGVPFGNSGFKNCEDENTCVNGTTDGYLSGKDYPEENFPFITDADAKEIKVLWNKSSSLGAGQVFESPNIKNIIQAIVDQDGWNDGTDKHHPYNSLVLLFKRDGTSSATNVSNSRSIFSADGVGTIPPKISITWERNGKPTSIAKTYNDLKFQRRNNTATNGWNTTLLKDQIRLGRRCLDTGDKANCSGNETLVGIHFPKLDIPKSAEITSAKIVFTHQNGLESTTIGRKDLDLFIYAEDSIDPKDFSKTASVMIGRNRIEPPIEWNNIPQLPAGLAENTIWNGEGTLPDGLKTIWEGEGEMPTTGYCTVDEKGLVTDPDCIKFTTPDLTSILQKVVEQDTWKRENDVVFLFETNATRNSDEELPDTVGFRRIVAPTDTTSDSGIVPYIHEDTTTLPKLEVTYQIAFEEDATEKQQVGLRFEAIDIPRGAKVESAYMTFTSAEDISTNANIIIKAELGSSETFTEEPFNISNREVSNASVSWSPKTWTKGLIYETPDLKNIIQEVVDGADWCSGDLAFIISASEDDITSIRKASSFDYMSGLAPELRVRFDTEDIKPGGGCVNQTYYSKISERFDDAEEKVSGSENGLVYLASPTLEMGVRDNEARLVAFHFREIPVGNGAEVVGVHLMVNAYKSNTNKDNATFNVYSELSPDTKNFSATDYDLSSRSSKTSIVKWEPGVWEKGKVYRTPNLAGVIQEIVNQPDWKAYNDVALFVKGTGRRDVVSFDDNQALAATLRIQIKGKLGEDGKGDIVTVRRRLQTLVKRMRIPNSRTPIVGALFESAQYYLGKKVVNGQSRNNEPFHLVSHPATHNSENNTPSDCNINLNPYAVECAGEEVAGVANYVAPAQSSTGSCQSSNHIVLLTDGRANVTKAQAVAQKSSALGLLPDNSCIDSFDLGDETIQISEAEECGIDLSDYLATKKNISVHTIGFQLGTAWLGKYRVGDGYVVGPKNGLYYDIPELDKTISTLDKKGRYISNSKRGSVLGYVKDVDETRDNLKAVDYLCRLASTGGGNFDKCSGRNFYLAATVEELATAFTSISAQATTKNSSFAAPSVSINNNNNLFHNNEVYYSLFKPGAEARWNGNVKKYQFIDGSLKDAKGNEVTDENGKIVDEAVSFWGNLNDADGGNVTAGGAGSKLVSKDRKIYTYFGDSSPGKDHKVSLINYQIKEFDFATTAFDKELVDELLVNDESAEEVVEVVEDESNSRDDKANELIRWILGKDVTEGEGSSTTSQSTDTTESTEEESQDSINVLNQGDRWMLADPLHSTPREVIYLNGSKEEEEASESRLFVGTNDGLIRMIDTADGQEKWAFLPKELVSSQFLMKNQMKAENTEHSYGVDATPTFMISRDEDGQIIPKEGNYVRMFIGMRRGGRNIYALNVSEKDGPPKLMWTIKGGETGFSKLGQTWSAPLRTEVASTYCSYAWCDALMFAGGYDPVVEDNSTFNPTKKVSMGNAIYMVYPKTGERLWWASNKGSGADLELSGMDYAIPSDLLLQDTTGDGLTDRIYVGDIAGQLWRINLGGEQAEGVIMARLGETYKPEKRSFFYPPALARIDSKNILTAITGARPNPLAGGIPSGSGYYAHDQFYAILDNKNDFTTPISIKDLEDVTNWDADSEHVNLKDTDKAGWFFNLQESDKSWLGEKGLGKPLVDDENVYFVTYVPASASSKKIASASCEAVEGANRFYAINLLDGGPAYKKDENGEFDIENRGTTGADRYKDIASGGIFDIVEFITDNENGPQKDYVVGTKTGLTKLIPPARVFWQQK